MSYKDIKAGNYFAKPTQGAFGRSKTKGTPQVQIEFAFTTPEGINESLVWTGYLTEKARARTFEVLGLIKFNGDPSFALDSFDQESQVEIVIEMEEHDSKFYPRIKWVNGLGGAKFSDLPVTEVKSMITELGIDLKKEMAALNLKSGSVPKKKNEAAPF